MLTVMGELYIGLRTGLLPSIIQVILVDHQFLIFMVITEVDTGLIPANFIHITMVKKKPKVFSRIYSKACARIKPT